MQFCSTWHYHRTHCTRFFSWKETEGEGEGKAVKNDFWRAKCGTILKKNSLSFFFEKLFETGPSGLWTLLPLLLNFHLGRHVSNQEFLEFLYLKKTKFWSHCKLVVEVRQLSKHASKLMPKEAFRWTEMRNLGWRSRATANNFFVPSYWQLTKITCKRGCRQIVKFRPAASLATHSFHRREALRLLFLLKIVLSSTTSLLFRQM